MPGGEDGDAYDRGYLAGEKAGEIAARLANHDAHLAAINGSIEKWIRELQKLTMAVQRLGDQAEAREAIVVTTAKALKDATEARRDRSEQSWSPIAKLIAAVGAVAIVLGAALALYQALN